MDLMRTLLIYMSATMALAVQNTTAPKETPVPSPAPNAVVETVKAPEAGATMIPGVTPGAVPTITPNMKGYHNLTMGAKGKDVKKLQQKLIDMGYLPEGSADGAYGRKTFNAVKKFQYYNGLTADGIAGRKTQTNLFENPDIVPNPEVTAAPEATPAPETAAPEAMEVLGTPAPEAEEADTEEVTTEEVTEETETAAPEAGEPAEATETPAEETEAPAEETEAPAAETEEPKAKAAETEAPAAAEAEEDADTDIVENLNLDADVYEQITASIALNEGDGPLQYVVKEDGVPVKIKPRVRYNGEKIRVSLDDLCAAVEKWQLTDEKAGSVVLEAAGYTLALFNESKGCSATVDGKTIPMEEDDFDFSTDGHFINAEFLAKALNGSAVWDQEESTLMLRILDKEAVATAD